MAEATWGEATAALNWRMSAALETVPRGDGELAEVTSLETAVRAWLALDEAHRAAAVLTPEHPVTLDGARHESFSAEGIARLSDHLPHLPADA